jgi:hypothetical protein
VACKVIIRDEHLESDSLVGDPGWLHLYGASPFTLYTDANFGLQFTWTDWQAPKKIFNAGNHVTFDKNDFEMTGHKFYQIENGSVKLGIDFHGTNNPSRIIPYLMC